MHVCYVCVCVFVNVHSFTHTWALHMIHTCIYTYIHSQVFVDDMTSPLIDNDKRHPAVQRKCGKITLKQGVVDIKVLYFAQTPKNPELTVTFNSPSSESKTSSGRTVKVVLTQFALKHKGIAIISTWPEH
jgi:hypothetical protein